MAAASETVSRRQPKLFSSGSIMTPGAERSAGRDQQAEKDDADHDEGVALAKGTRLSYHVTDRYVADVIRYTYRSVTLSIEFHDASGQKY